MGKLQNVTAEQIKETSDRGSDLCAELWGIHNRLEKGYCDEIPSVISFARSFLSLSRSAADIAAMLLSRAAFDELKRETEEAIRARVKP